jgi:hypothetical protein
MTTKYITSRGESEKKMIMMDEEEILVGCRE